MKAEGRRRKAEGGRRQTPAAAGLLVAAATLPLSAFAIVGLFMRQHGRYGPAVLPSNLSGALPAPAEQFAAAHGFEIRAAGGRLFLAGVRPRGTLFAMYEFKDFLREK